MKSSTLQLIIFYLPTTVFFSCNEASTESQQTMHGKPKEERISFLYLEDQDKYERGRYYADSSYCIHLNKNHTGIRDYYNLQKSVYAKYQYIEKLKLKIGKSSKYASSLQAISDTVNHAMSDMENMKQNLVRTCGGFCNPEYTDIHIPILPDRTLDVAYFWEVESHQEKLENLISRVWFAFEKYGYQITGLNNRNSLKNPKTEILYRAQFHELFNEKSTVEALKVFAQIEGAVSEMEFIICKKAANKVGIDF